MERALYSESVHWDLWEAAAARVEQADKYCSSPFWGLPLAHAFHVRSQLYIYRDGQDLGVFQELDVEGGRVILPCDVMWCLGSPILAQDGADFLHRLSVHWEKTRQDVYQITIAGPYTDSPIWQSRVWKMYPHWEQSAAGRQVASLEGGVDGFMSRRSTNFRSRLRRAVKKAEETGVRVEFWPHQADRQQTLELLERAMRVEQESWKGIAGQGVNRGQMNDFYRAMLPRLAARGRLRGIFLTRDGRDLSYLFGASFAEGFRGLQFSFLETESSSLGNVGQWHMLCHLVEQGCQFYDLGQAMEYKSRWAERLIPTGARSFLIS